uniref:Uncharacterized protein n=1 Tax=Bionectria ochroleuca TaxID=29856 RepID=A0A8H7NL27_BIOOC
MLIKPSGTSPLVMVLGAILFFSAQVFAASAALGVDLGTEYIKAALVKPGKPFDVVLTKDSRRKETSAVAFKPSRGAPQSGEYPERLYGSDAMALAARFPGDVYPNLKALLGLPVDDALVQEYAARHPSLKIQAHPSRGTAQFKSSAVSAEEDAWLVEELLAMELQSIQKNAEAAAGDGTSVRSIVLTIPPFYTADERRAVQAAADLAGLRVLGTISDGLAVGLNYATTRQFPNINKGGNPEYHMVFDMGAGSTKATVMRFQSREVKDVGKHNKTVQEVQVIGTGSDRTLGGDALNNLIIDDMIEKFVESKAAQKASVTAEGVKAHGRAIAKLTKEAERVRHVLSANQNTVASFEGLYDDVNFKYKIERADFEELAKAHADRVAAAVNSALKQAKLEMDDLDSVILHGGASRTPFVQKALEKVVGSADKLRSNVNSDEAAVFGAGFRAADLSPGFRVKEIRISDGPGYAAGLKWKASEERTQRLWTPISTIGGPAKELSFNEEADFSGTFYQQVDAEYKDLKRFTTKNLTSSIAALKEKYPSCVESGVTFRLGAKLDAEDGEIDIVKAAVECEAEVKEGFVDGVKNLFGFGKKDQEQLNGDESASTETVNTSEESDTKSATESSESAEASGSTEELKTEVKKLETVSIPVEIVIEILGTPQLTKEQTKQSKDRLKAFAASDLARYLREEALNQLEGFTYKVRDLLEDESFIAASTEAERTSLSEKASAASEWLYDEGADAPRTELKARLKQLQDIADPVQKRVTESGARPAAISKLRSSLKETFKFVDTMRKQIDEYDEWHAAASASSSAAPSATPSGDFDGLEDDDTSKDKKMEDVLEERGPVPPLYKREDLDELAALSKTTEEWINENEAKQDKVAATADPVLLVKDVTAKVERLEKAGKDLAMKGVKNYSKGSKKGSKEKPKDKGKKKGGKGGKGKPTKLGDLKDKNFESLSAEDLEDLIKNMSEEDWAKVRKEAEAQQKQAEAEPSVKPHDEL